MKQQLPGDVLEEILSRLQVKDILRFRSVSKQWLSITSTPIFVRLHLNKSIPNPRILVPYDRTCKIIDYINSGDVSTDLPMPNETISPKIVGTCDGLVCFLDYDYKDFTKPISLCLWNPALRAFRTTNLNIPTVESSRIDDILFSWFGRDSDSNDDYKLVIGIKFKSVLKGKKLSSRRLIVIRPFAEDEDDDYYYYDNQPIADKCRWWHYGLAVVLHGVVHWCAYRRGRDMSDVLFWYDLSRKTLGEMPSTMKGYDTRLSSICVLDGCLAEIRCGGCYHEFWIMKEYGVEKSWTRLMVIPSDLIIKPPHPGMVLIGVADNGDLILESNKRGHVLMYNVKEKQRKVLGYNQTFVSPNMYLQTDEASGSAIMYFETLICP